MLGKAGEGAPLEEHYPGKQRVEPGSPDRTQLRGS